MELQLVERFCVLESKSVVDGAVDSGVCGVCVVDVFGEGFECGAHFETAVCYVRHSLQRPRYR